MADETEGYTVGSGNVFADAGCPTPTSAWRAPDLCAASRSSSRSAT